MSNFNLTPEMGLPNPVPSADPGPDYAVNIQACYNIIDGHNHSVGSGNQINPSAIVINADLPFNSNNATLLRSVRFVPQSATLSGPQDIGCLYESGVDLWYNDASGNQVQITSGGLVNATSSGISSPPASAAFSGGVLVVNENTNTPGNIQAGSILIGNNVVSSNFVTLSAPNALAASYPIVFPTALPGATSLVTLDASGNLGAGTTAATPTFTSVTVTGALTVGTTASIGGDLTASSNLSVGGDEVIDGTLQLGGAGGPVLSRSVNISDAVQFNGGISLGATNGVNTPYIYKFSANSAAVWQNGVPGSANKLPIVVSAIPSTNSLMVVRGTVNSSGTAISGEGFSSANTGTGIVHITFTTAFQDAPAMTATLTSAITGNIYAIAVLTLTSAGAFVNTAVGEALSNLSFSFIAIGQRSSSL